MPIFPFFQPRPPKIVDFGNFHKEFEKQLKKKSYLVQEINVRHVKDFDGNFYLIEIHPKIQQNHNEPYCQFIAKIKEDLENPGKSTLFRRAEISENPMKPNKTMQHSIINVDYNYHYNCARWLCSILGEPEFRIDKLEVMFPPRCDILDVFELRNFVERLEIYVDKEEQDPLLLIGWLDKFDKERLNYVKITSENVRIEVKMSEFLQNIHTLEIYGKNDVDLQWIYTSKTLKFVQNLSDNLVLTDEEIKSICEHLMDQSSSNKMLFFDQGTIERGKELKKWLREKYSDHLVGVDHFQRKIDGEFWRTRSMETSMESVGKTKNLQECLQICEKNVSCHVAFRNSTTKICQLAEFGYVTLLRKSNIFAGAEIGVKINLEKENCGRHSKSEILQGFRMEPPNSLVGNATRYWQIMQKSGGGIRFMINYPKQLSHGDCWGDWYEEIITPFCYNYFFAPNYTLVSAREKCAIFDGNLYGFNWLEDNVFFAARNMMARNIEKGRILLGARRKYECYMSNKTADNCDGTNAFEWIDPLTTRKNMKFEVDNINKECYALEIPNSSKPLEYKFVNVFCDGKDENIVGISCSTPLIRNLNAFY